MFAYPANLFPILWDFLHMLPLSNFPGHTPPPGGYQGMSTTPPPYLEGRSGWAVGGRTEYHKAGLSQGTYFSHVLREDMVSTPPLP